MGTARGRRGSLLLTLLLVCVALACGDEGADEGGPPTGNLSLVSTLGGLDTVGYERATEIRDFVFPEDHGPHPGFRTEWWYVTGNLTSDAGRDFGFQFTIFRSSLSPTEPGGPSAWATNQAYMGHFAVTDIDGGAFEATDLFARGSGGLAGAQTTPLRVWIEDWVLESAAAASGQDRGSAEGVGASGSETFPLRLAADGDNFAVELELEAGKPIVFQGDRGLSQKGPQPGNASYYYALTRMPAVGSVVFDGETHAVTGLTWLDREWSTSALSDGQVGWDWFALQLDDGWEMMVYQLRLEDGTPDPLSDGVLIDLQGRRIPLEWGEEVEVVPTGTWRSPEDGAEYPSGWRIRVPDRGWDLTVEPVVDDQELRLAFRYWEGSVAVEGRGEGGAPVAGRGYVELTGYAGFGAQGTTEER
ncbi:MAG: carotenoid 1,2-hydratase [Gemmatimonadetes bacterium]|nr:carotenoid 1,2-hydratase [Gemmatimonadota bacterium]NNL31133.1 carotenoid 1,2-hydratase [Gemmatimonadota bacterium]